MGSWGGAAFFLMFLSLILNKSDGVILKPLYGADGKLQGFASIWDGGPIGDSSHPCNVTCPPGYQPDHLCECVPHHGTQPDSPPAPNQCPPGQSPGPNGKCALTPYPVGPDGRCAPGQTLSGPNGPCFAVPPAPLPSVNPCPPGLYPFGPQGECTPAGPAGPDCPPGLAPGMYGLCVPITNKQCPIGQSPIGPNGQCVPDYLNSNAPKSFSSWLSWVPRMPWMKR